VSLRESTGKKACEQHAQAMRPGILIRSVLGVWAFSHGRGTPVGHRCESLSRVGVWTLFFTSLVLRHPPTILARLLRDQIERQRDREREREKTTLLKRAFTSGRSFRGAAARLQTTSSQPHPYTQNGSREESAYPHKPGELSAAPDGFRAAPSGPRILPS